MYDPRCEELAEIFLAGDPDYKAGEVQGLTQAIQDAVENWFGGRGALAAAATKPTV